MPRVQSIKSASSNTAEVQVEETLRLIPTPGVRAVVDLDGRRGTERAAVMESSRHHIPMYRFSAGDENGAGSGWNYGTSNGQAALRDSGESGGRIPLQ